MSTPAITFAVSLVAGILASYAGLPAIPLVGAALTAGAVLEALFGSTPRARAACIGAAVTAAGAAAGWGLGDKHYHTFPDDHVRRIATDERQTVVLEGVVADEPQFREHQFLRWTSLRLEAESLTIGGVRRSASGLVATYIWWDEPPPVAYGQRLRLSGSLSRPEPPMNPGEVDRRVAFAHDRIYAVLRVSERNACDVLDAAAGNPLLRAAFALKRRLRDGIRSVASGEGGAFLESILLGTRESLDPDIEDDFVRTGTVHVLAISGQHLTLIGAMLLAVLTHLGRISKRKAEGVVLAFAIVYCAITGASPSILRATIMIAILLVGRLVAREPRPMNSLAIAAIVILIHDPGDLMNVGFQLSFAAIGGLALLYTPMKEAYLELLPELGARAGRARRLAFHGAWIAGDAVLISIAAWVATAPLIVWHFHLITPGTVPANVLIAVPVWIVLSAGVLVLFTAPASALLAKPFALLATGAATILVWTVGKLARVPGTYLFVPDVHGMQVIGAYAGLGALAWAGAHGWRPRWLVGVAPVAAALVLAPLPSPPVPEGEARVAVLSVGKGLTTVVRTREATVLFDCGAGRTVEPGARTIAPYLWRRGVRAIDAIFLSHAHDDHTNAVLDIVDRFRVKAVFTNPEFGELTGGRRILARLAARGVPVVALERGARRELAGIDVAVLGPALERPVALEGSRGSGGSGGSQHTRPGGKKRAKDRQNDRSLVLLVKTAGHRLLLPGDLEEAGTDALLRAFTRKDEIGADVLLIPHHGSDNRYSEELAGRVRARVAIASTRDRFASAATLCAYEDVGTGVIETWASGCVEMALRPGRMVATAFAGGLPDLPSDRPPPPVLPEAPPIGPPPVVDFGPIPDDLGCGEPYAPLPRRRPVLAEREKPDPEARPPRRPALAERERRRKQRRHGAQAGAADMDPATAARLARIGDVIAHGFAHARAAVAAVPAVTAATGE